MACGQKFVNQPSLASRRSHALERMMNGAAKRIREDVKRDT